MTNDIFRAGNVETSGGGQRVFGAVANSDTEIAVMIRRSLETVGRAADTELTTSTDGAPGLRSILSEAGCHAAAIEALLRSWCTEARFASNVDRRGQAA